MQQLQRRTKVKLGMNLQELAAEVQRQATTKRDFVADTRRMAFNSNGASHLFIDDVEGEFKVSDIAHGQVAARLGIPKKYYDRMRSEAPKLLDENVQTWFREKPEKRMVRTLDGNARAFLSDRYRRIDNVDIANAVLPIIGGIDGDVVSCELTARKMYVKVAFPGIEAPIRDSKRGVGDILRSGVIFENSEVGMGAFSIRPFFVALICVNGMVADQFAIKQYHVGARIEETEAAYELFTDETLKADDEAFILKVRDVCAGYADLRKFEQIVEQLSELTQLAVGDPIGAVEQLENKYDLREGESRGILTHLVEGGDLTAWGFVNAVTRYAADVDDYDRATEFEELGGKLTALPRAELATLLATERAPTSSFADVA